MPRMPAPASSNARSSARDRRDARGEVGHVERPGNAVDQADADQEQQRGREVDHDVVQPGLDARGPEPCSARP